jgi:undecaprenyl-diphosphatase
MSGLSRKASVQFAMILSIPVIIGASVKSGTDIIWQDQVAVLDTAITAAGLAFITALISIAIMMWVIEKLGMKPFVIYRIILGIILIGLAFQI